MLWDSSLHSELEGSQFQSNWYARPGFTTQPHYEDYGDLRLELELTLWLKSGEWGCLLISTQSWPWGSQTADKKIYCHSCEKYSKIDVEFYKKPHCLSVPIIKKVFIIFIVIKQHSCQILKLENMTLNLIRLYNLIAFSNPVKAIILKQ